MGTVTLDYTVLMNIPGTGGGGGGPFLLSSFPTGNTVLLSLSKENSAYAGAAFNCRRSSDNATQDIGFNSSGFADPVAFAAFVGSGTGYVTTWYDQNGGLNATQPTATRQWMAFVDTDGNLSFTASLGIAVVSASALAGTSVLTFAFGFPLQGTPTVGMYVFYLGNDQGDGNSTVIVPGTTITAINVGAGTITLSAPLGTGGVSAFNYIGFGVGAGGGMSIADSAKYKTAQVELFMIAKPGAQQQMNDTAHLSGEIGGNFIGYGPVGSAYNDYWSVGLQQNGANQWVYGNINASGSGQTFEYAYGQGMFDLWMVWNWASHLNQLTYNGTLFQNLAQSNTITYPTSNPLTLGNRNGFGFTPSAVPWDDYRGGFRAVIMYDGSTVTPTIRAGINTFLFSKWSIQNFQTALPADSTGFTSTANQFPTFVPAAADSNGIHWWQENGAYQWSFRKYNTTNGVEYVRFEIRALNSDMIVTGAERCERGGTLTGTSDPFGPGIPFDIVAQFLIEPGPVQLGSWSDQFQVHYGGGGSPTVPDICVTSVLGEIIQVNTGGNSVQAYAVGASFSASASGTNMTVSSVNGGTLLTDATSPTGVGHQLGISANGGVPTGTRLVSQTSGTTGGAGVYVTSNALTIFSGQNVLSGIALQRGVWYAFRYSGTWGASAGGDSFSYYLGLNGTTLTQWANLTGKTLYDHGAGLTAYPKQGIYRGNPYPQQQNNGSGGEAVQIANHKASATANAFASFVTSQPALPTN